MGEDGPRKGSNWSVIETLSVKKKNPQYTYEFYLGPSILKNVTFINIIDYSQS